MIDNDRAGIARDRAGTARDRAGTARDRAGIARDKWHNWSNIFCFNCYPLAGMSGNDFCKFGIGNEKLPSPFPTFSVGNGNTN